MNNLLKKAKNIIESDIKSIGFISDSDNTYYLYDVATRFINNNNTDKIDNFVQEIKDNILINYNSISEINARGDYEVYYYLIDKDFTDMKDFKNYFLLV